MNFLVDLSHPAHLHFFKNMIKKLERDGNQVQITAREKDVLIPLLDAYNFDYSIVGGHAKGTLGKSLNMLRRDLGILKIARSNNSDILIGSYNPYIAHVGKLIGKPSITFADTENVGFEKMLTFPFTDVICTPQCFRERIDEKKHVRFNGYKELAYLHPNYFKPDPAVLDEAGIGRKDRFTIIRFISWNALHDISLKGIGQNSEVDFVEKLKEYGDVLITSEKKLSSKLEKYNIKIDPSKIHSLLSYAQLYIGEGGTMATEAAVLGTPSVHIEALRHGGASGEMSGNFLELRDKYRLMYMFPDYHTALRKASQILEMKNPKAEWKKRRNKLLRDKIDVTEWMTKFVKNYPQSFNDYKEKVNA
jgi:predicted glycosyltransferase